MLGISEGFKLWWRKQGIVGGNQWFGHAPSRKENKHLVQPGDVEEVQLTTCHMG